MEVAANIKAPPLPEALIARRSAIIGKWLEQTLQTYPESSNRFLSREKDPFRNPVGYTLKEGLSALFDGVVRETDITAMASVLDGIVRIRAVQDFSASQAVSFIFLLKQVIRLELNPDIERYPEELAALEGRIDEMALLAFDLFMRCRQQIYEVGANEVRRRVSVLERERWLVEEESIG